MELEKVDRFCYVGKLLNEGAGTEMAPATRMNKA
jgi:hypothetical protein